jgi:hypothetical protein
LSSCAGGIGRRPYLLAHTVPPEASAALRLVCLASGSGGDPPPDPRLRCSRRPPFLPRPLLLCSRSPPPRPCAVGHGVGPDGAPLPSPPSATEAAREELTGLLCSYVAAFVSHARTTELLFAGVISTRPSRRLPQFPVLSAGLRLFLQSSSSRRCRSRLPCSNLHKITDCHSKTFPTNFSQIR